MGPAAKPQAVDGGRVWGETGSGLEKPHRSEVDFHSAVAASAELWTTQFSWVLTWDRCKRRKFSSKSQNRGMWHCKGTNFTKEEPYVEVGTGKWFVWMAEPEMG
jgi:hypothetical protein